VIREEVAAAGSACRFGGDEFICLLHPARSSRARRWPAHPREVEACSSSARERVHHDQHRNRRSALDLPPPITCRLADEACAAPDAPANRVSVDAERAWVLPEGMRLVVALLLAHDDRPARLRSRARRRHGPTIRAALTRPEASTAPCQYLAALGCCEQRMLPATASPEAPAARVLPAAAIASIAPLAPATAPPAGVWRAGHGPPEAPFLRAIVLQL
jgi:hypothetical protein